MNFTINSRIKEVRRMFCAGSNVKFAAQLGKEPNTTSNWVRDGYSVGGGVASEIASKFPVSIDWLLTGEGEMLKPESRKEPPAQLELDFSKIADACLKNADSMQELISIHAGLARSNEKLVESNAKLVDQFTTTLSRLEKKIDEKIEGGTVSEPRSML